MNSAAEIRKPKRYFFLTNEDALVFTSKVNSRREALGHYGRALVRTDINSDETAFLARSVRTLKSQLQELLAF